ncbi:hypothetical protein LTS08_006674 [Lithohypha guttulata]|nr:hypothetical protein LTS08_006674 [Lithohypha guttulata]
MSSYLISGASRGLGLELVRQLSLLPSSQVSSVFAITRGPSDQLNKLISSQSDSSRITNVVIQDLTSAQDVAAGVSEVEKHLAGKGLDVVVNNAGAMTFTNGKVWDMPGEDLAEIFRTNVVTAQVLTAGCVDLLKRGIAKKIVNISTTLGSMTQVHKYSWASNYSYKISKAAMNMLTAQYAIGLGQEGFTTISVTPGWLKTDMGSAQADLDVEVGVAAVVDIILKSTVEQNGKFLNIKVDGWENAQGPNQYDGAEVPW